MSHVRCTADACKHRQACMQLQVQFWCCRVRRKAPGGAPIIAATAATTSAQRLLASPAPAEECCLLLCVQLVWCGGLVPWRAAGDDQLVGCGDASQQQQSNSRSARQLSELMCPHKLLTHCEQPSFEAGQPGRSRTAMQHERTAAAAVGCEQCTPTHLPAPLPVRALLPSALLTVRCVLWSPPQPAGSARL